MKANEVVHLFASNECDLSLCGSKGFLYGTHRKTFSTCDGCLFVEHISERVRTFRQMLQYSRVARFAIANGEPARAVTNAARAVTCYDRLTHE